MPFTEEEVQQIVEMKMKLGKTSGLDGTTAEHIRYGGHTITVWLTEIFNAIANRVRDDPISPKDGCYYTHLQGRRQRSIGSSELSWRHPALRNI